MNLFNGGGSENPKENWNLSDKAGLTPRKTGNAAFAVRSKPSFVTSGAHAVVIHGFQHRLLWLFAYTHTHTFFNQVTVLRCVIPLCEKCHQKRAVWYGRALWHGCIFNPKDSDLWMPQITCNLNHLLRKMHLINSTFCCSRDKKTVLQLTLN